MESTTPSPDDQTRAAPTAFVSYAHGDERWNATVLDFATVLRTVGGIDADLDQWQLIGGQDWTIYGPAAIELSDVILIVLSPTYKDAWLGRNAPDRNPGVARESAAIKAIFDEDQSEFRKRIRLVLLPGADQKSVPGDLSTLERFTVSSFDMPGIESLLRSILDQPANVKPKLAPLPALPQHTVEGIMQRDDVERPVTVTTTTTPSAETAAAQVTDDNPALADKLASRLEDIERLLASTRGGPAGEGVSDELLEERSAVKGSLDAVERALPDGVARQRMIGNYLNAQLYFSAGAYRAAERRLVAVAESLDDRMLGSANSDVESCLRELTTAVRGLNEGMRGRRYAAGTEARHPAPPDLTFGPERANSVHEFYEVARRATSDPSAIAWAGVIRKAILRGRDPAHADGLYARYTEQHKVAELPLDLGPQSHAGDGAGAFLLATTSLGDRSNSVAADVLSALAKAHLEIHLVEHRRSGAVGEILGRGKVDIRTDKEYLRRSIVLNTFALAITEALPWIFAADGTERDEVQVDEAVARRDLAPARAMWLSRQVTLLALYRRSHGFRLLGDHERAYDDLRRLQRIGRLTRLARPDDEKVTGWVDTLEALAEYRIGELYRADHDYMQALVHLCRSHDSVLNGLEDRPGSTIGAELGHLQIKLSLGKGKAFFEIGAIKRSLKWHITAWRWLLALETPGMDLERQLRVVEKALDDVKHDPVLYKPAIQRTIGPTLEAMCGHDLDPTHHALEADILVRIGHLLTSIRLPEDEHNSASGSDSSALLCMRRAATLDPHNLLVQTGLLRYEMHQGVAISGRTPENPLSCWPSGASDVDQMIRVAEHLMLERLHAAGGPRGMGEIGVARALMRHFMTHTDSINLRGAILHRYLMRLRAEDREPWYDDVDAKHGRGMRDAPAGGSAPYLEFVCLRRFGSFTPFMPRPAAVSAVGGGYLVRVVCPPQDGGNGRVSIFNIVVDPGEGAVNNLYAMGLSIADIDMVMATHDHPEHLAALDAILSLRGEYQRRDRVRPADPERPSDGKQRLLILGNRSVVNRYSFLNGDGDHLVQHIADASVLGGDRIPEGVAIEQLPTKHEDLGGHDASGFVLSLCSRVPDGREASLRIAFMADTAIEGLYKDQSLKTLDSAWESALTSDIVVAHVSDVPIGELRTLADLPSPARGNHAVLAFDEAVRKLAEERPADASQLMHALSLVPAVPSDKPVSLLKAAATDGADQLYLRGLLAVCDLMCKAATPPPGAPARILIVGELKEQLGSFRGTIAREINRRVLGLDEARARERWPPVIAVTADIGLRIRLAAASFDEGAKVGGSTAVLCSTCSYNNDRLDLERFHPPDDIYEVCVKGDHEAMYWNCKMHDPGTRQRPKFVEQMGSYNPFAAGGRYHG
jgi:hypothetical protein